MNQDTKSVSFIPLGGIGDVTKNMYLYEYDNQILIVDCGIGFTDETMLGVDLLIPDISYLLQTNKKIVGMILTHGHEDHMGALPFILPQLTEKSSAFPIFATPLTAALANEKLKEFGVSSSVQTVPFGQKSISMGSFEVSFFRVTHSVPDSANLFIKTPIGNLYHGSDFKFDLTPTDGKKTELQKIAKAGAEGILCLFSDCLGAERSGSTPSEEVLNEHFEKEMRECKGKFIVTTYSSNISRLNQAIQIAEKFNRKVCFVGRSLLRAKEVAQRLGYMKLRQGLEIQSGAIKKYDDRQLLIFAAGSQGQENSALSRIANGDSQDIKLKAHDVVIFSADTIPGNEASVNFLMDTIAKKGAKVVYSDINDNFHVSGHGSSDDLMLMMSLTTPKKLLPISGTFRHMVAYRLLAKKMGYRENDVFLIEDGQEVVLTKDTSFLGKKITVRNVYVDEITGEEVEGVVLRDRQMLSEGGVVIVMAQVNSATGQIIDNPDIITRGFLVGEGSQLQKGLMQEITRVLSKNKGRVTNWMHIRKLIGTTSERYILKDLRRRPLVLPVLLEV